MFKRYQVLLPIWFDDSLKFKAERYELSISEVIRLELCFATICVTKERYPDYKPDKTIKELFHTIREYPKRNIEREDFLKLTSQIYFEARKAMDFRLKRGRRGKKGSVRKTV